MSDNNNDFGSFLAGFVIGGLVGAAAALILAPQSGEQTRSQLLTRGQELRQASNERVHDYRERAGAYVEETRGRVSDAGQQAQERARLVLDEGRSRVEQGRTRLASVVDEGKGKIQTMIETGRAKLQPTADNSASAESQSPSA